MTSFDCTIANLTTTVSCDNAAFVDRLVAYLGPFVNSSGTPVCTVHCETKEPWTEPHDSETFVIAETVSGGFEFRDTASCGTVDSCALRATVQMLPDPKVFDRMLRMLYAHFLPYNNGLLLHSAAIAHRDHGFLFPGVSGTGKSTISRIAASKGEKVLSDEISAVRCVNSRQILFGTPFWGEFRGVNCADSYPLAAVLHPVKASALRFDTAAPAETVRALLRSVMHFRSSSTASETVLEVVSTVASTVPAHRMKFALSSNPWEVLS